MRQRFGRFLAVALVLGLSASVWAQPIPGGTYTVGLGGNYTSLTSAVSALNSRGVGGAVTFSLISSSYSSGETFPITINVTANKPTSSNTVTFKPASGVTATISGSVSAAAVIKIDLTDYIIIDGSNTAGGTTRDLTIENTAATQGSKGVWIAGGAKTTLITGITIKNCKLRTGGINAGAGIIGADRSNPLVGGWFSNVIVENNLIERAYHGILLNGSNGANKSVNVTVTDNVITSTGSNAVRNYGIYVARIDGITIRRNEIANLDPTAQEFDVGIAVGDTAMNAVVEQNYIHDLTFTNFTALGGGPHGIGVATGLGSGATSSNITIRNNMISNITGNGDTVHTGGLATGCPSGIHLTTNQMGRGQKDIFIYSNTIHLYGSTIDTSGHSIGISMDAGQATVKGNIVINKLGSTPVPGPMAMAIYAASSTQLVDLDYNDYYCNAPNSFNAIARVGSTVYYTLAAFQAATGKDAHSISRDVTFASSLDLHLPDNSLAGLFLRAAPVSGVTADYDGDARSTFIPVMGADEPTSVVVNAKAFLEGPFSGSAMTTTLNSGGYLPLAQPYTGSPWSYGGLESVTSHGASVTDWIEVQLRSSLTTTVASRAALLKNDGTIVDIDGSSPVRFFTVPSGSYYVVLKHRNHIPIMSSAAQALTGSSSLYNFTTAAGQAYGTGAMKALTGGVFGLYTGDADVNGGVGASDLVNVRTQIGATGYFREDVDMNGGGGASDLVLVRGNIGQSSQLP